MAVPKTLLKNPVSVYAERRQNLAGVVHEALGTTEKEGRRVQIGHVPGDKFLSEVSGVPLPGWIRPRQAHLILEVGQRPSESHQFVVENDVRLRA